MDFEFYIPLNQDDLLHQQGHGQYAVREVASLRELPAKLQESYNDVTSEGCAFILEHFDVLYSVLVHSKQLGAHQMKHAVDLVMRGMQQMCDCLPAMLEDDIQPELQKKMLNIAKMTMYIFGEVVRHIEDKKAGKDMLLDLKSRKNSAKSAEENEWAEERNRRLIGLYGFLQLPLQKLWDPPVAEEEFVNLAANVCYKVLEDTAIGTVKMKPTRETVFQILGTLVTRYQHGLSCTVKIVQLLKIYEHLCGPLAEGVVILVQDYGCRGLIREIVREISDSEAAYDTNGARAFSLFLTEIAKNASDLILPIMSLLLPHLDNDPYTMRNCVLDIMGEIVVQTLSSETLEEQQKETRDMFLDHLQDHLLDTNAYVRAKALKIWQRLAQEKSIPISRFGDLLTDVVVRLGDVSWTVVRYAVHLVRAVLENNPFGAKMDLDSVREKLEAEEKILTELEAEAQNLDSMTRPQRWEALLPAITLAIEEALQSNVSDVELECAEGMDQAEMLATLQNIRANIDESNFKEAFLLVRSTEKMFPGASELRKENRLEWQVDYFIRLMRKIYVEMEEEADEEDKENQANAAEKREKKKGGKRRLQDLHPDEDAKPEETAAVKAVGTQTKIVQFLKDCIQFAEEMQKAVRMICSLLHSNQGQVIQEAIEFLSAAFMFGFDQTVDGVRQMLLLVWSSEAPIKEAVATAYKSLYLQSPSTVPRLRAVEIVRNLCKLLGMLGQNEQAALEILVKEWVTSDAIDKACVQVMWERFSRTLKDTSLEESRAALRLLTMVANAKLQTVQTNLDVMVRAGMGEKGARDSILIRDTCRALLKLVPSGQPAACNDEPIRYPGDHCIFQTLGDVLREGFCSLEDSAYQQMAEEALDVIYQLSEQPDVTCEPLLRDLVLVVQDSKCAELEESSCPAELLSRLIFFIGHVAFRQWIHLDKSIFRELKRRNRVREHHFEQIKEEKEEKNALKGRKKSRKEKNKDQSLSQSSFLSASNIMQEKQEAEADEVGGDIAADDAEAEYINSVCESEIVTGSNLLSKLSSIVVTVCANPHKFSDVHLRSTASVALTKLMLVSSEFCEQHLQLVFTMMEKSAEPQIRSNLVYAIGDLANRFPNLIEPWTKHLYARLRDKSSQVRQDTMMVLKYLITNEMVKVRGQISDLALCIVDSEPKISIMASSLFQELANKGNTLYNVMPDIISRLSSPTLDLEEDKFQTIMKFLMQLIQKDRQMESLVDKLCQRFRASTSERQWSDLAYCLGLMQYSDRSLRRLLENLPCYAEKLTVSSIYDTFCNILTQAGRTQKAERLQIVEELQTKIEECLRKGLPQDVNSADSQDSQEESGRKTSTVATPARKSKIVPRTPATARRRGGRAGGRGGRRNTRKTRNSSSEEESQSSDEDAPPKRKTNRRRREQSSSDSDDDDVFKKPARGRGRRN